MTYNEFERLLYNADTKEDMMLIYGVGATLEHLQDNEKVQQLPDKCVDALDAWVESLSEEERN